MAQKRKTPKSRAQRHLTRYPHVNAAKSYSNAQLLEAANNGNIECKAELSRRGYKPTPVSK